jgi:hypothetical protein
MKNTFLLLISILSFQFSFSQCDEYYINKLISGHDNLQPGSKIRFCPSLNGVSIAGELYKAYKWSGVSTQYITLSQNGGIAGFIVLDLKNKKFEIKYVGATEAEEYYISLSESDYNDFVSLGIEKDKLTIQKIIEEIKNKNYYKSYKLYYETMNWQNIPIENEVKKHWEFLKRQIDSAYSIYNLEFDNKKNGLIKEILYNKEQFQKNNTTSISNSITSFNEINNKSYNNKSIFLEIEKDTFKIFPFGHEYHFEYPWGDTSKISSIQFKIEYFDKINTFKPIIILKNNKISFDTLFVVNEINFNQDKFSYGYTGLLNEYYNQFISQDGKLYFEQNFPKKDINFEYEIEFPNKLNYSDLKNSFSVDFIKKNKKLFQYAEIKSSLIDIKLKSNVYKNLINYFGNKNVDTIILCSNNEFPVISNNTILLSEKRGDVGSFKSLYRTFSFYALKKGEVEIHDSLVRFYSNDGKFQEFIIKNSIIEYYNYSDLKKLSLDPKKVTKKQVIEYKCLSFKSLSKSSDRSNGYYYNNKIQILQYPIIFKNFKQIYNDYQYEVNSSNIKKIIKY